MAGDERIRRTGDRTVAPPSMEAKHFGRFGEAAAARWYRRAGYRVLARNWRCPDGEIDLVVANGDGVVFVEVKSRTDGRYGTGVEAVDWRKQRRLRRVAGRWLEQAGGAFAEVRVDVVEVDRQGRLQVHEGCVDS